MGILSRICTSIVLIGISQLLVSQEQYEVEILHANQAISETRNLESVKILVGNVRLRHKMTLINCDSAIVYQNNNIDAFGNVTIQKKNTKIQGDFLQYFSLQKLAVLNNNIVLTDRKAKLVCQDMTYDMTSEQAYYMKGGKLINDRTQITSQIGTYFLSTSTALFRQNVVVSHPDYKLKSDTLTYATKEKKSIFSRGTLIESDSGIIFCNSGWYNEEKNQSSFGKGTYIKNPSSWILTDSIYYDKANKQSYIYKTFEYHDTAAKIHLFGDSAILIDDNRIMKAFKRPTLIIESNENSNPTFVRGDILISEKKNDKRELLAIHKVKVYNQDFQALGDTMIYLEKDSLMRIKKNPIVWYDQNQITGKDIWVYFRMKKPQKMIIYESAFMIEETYTNYFNQISADTIYTYFKDGKVNLLTAHSLAKSIYYGKEDGKGYLGLNNSESYSLKAIFDSSKLQKIIFYDEPKAEFIPVKQINEANSKLQGFIWQSALRPKSKEDL